MTRGGIGPANVKVIWRIAEECVTSLLSPIDASPAAVGKIFFFFFFLFNEGHRQWRCCQIVIDSWYQDGRRGGGAAEYRRRRDPQLWGTAGGSGSRPLYTQAERGVGGALYQTQSPPLLSQSPLAHSPASSAFILLSSLLYHKQTLFSFINQATSAV